MAEELRSAAYEKLLRLLAAKVPCGPSNTGNRGLSLGGDRGYSAAHPRKYFAEQLAVLDMSL